MKITEIEQKMFLGSSIDEESFHRLKEVKSIGGFVLREYKEYKIIDTYFDTKNFLLEKNNSYLRLRSKNAQHLITLRLLRFEDGKERIIDEVTHPQDDKGFQMVFSQLAKFNLLTYQPNFSQSDFLKVLKSSGLLEVISINNERIERNIFFEDIKIGRVKFDHYFYVPYENKRFFEIEIDTYKNIFLEGIKRFKNALKDLVKCPIIETDKSKYRRGLEEAFFVNPILKDLHGVSNN